MRIGVLTSGGDCPGLNAVIRGVVRKVERVHGGVVVGFRDAWRGVLDDVYEIVDVNRCRGILPRGGTILGTSRTQPYEFPDGVETVKATMARHDLEGFIVIGGEGSLGAARDLYKDGVPCIGVPKTIDNDIAGTDVTFGFDTAVHVASAAIDRLHTTAEAHDRVIVVEVMGRHVGHIATWAGNRRRGDDDADSRGSVRHRRGLRRARTSSRRHELRLDRGGRRGRDAGRGHARAPRVRGRPVRPPAARRHLEPVWPPRSRAGPGSRPG